MNFTSSTPPGFTEGSWQVLETDQRAAWLIKEHVIQLHALYDAFDTQGRLDEFLLWELEKLSPETLAAIAAALKG